MPLITRNALQQEEEVVQRLMESMQQRIDEGENIMNICKYHIYYVIGSSRLLTVSLCKSIMPFLPVRVQSQDPRLLYTSLIHGYHVTHLLESRFVDFLPVGAHPITSQLCS